ncbi:MAG TPA: hypothetical protein VJT73_16935, partial [Polyangiaceae bacterium]|nr:hypothetical protein [Polyangiaceae bacterium]
MHRRRGVWLGGCLAIIAAAPPAIAQPTVNDVYDDAKDIITELIERDVAESIAPNLACYSPGGLLKYFPATLQAIHERSFGAVKDVLKREAIALAGNYAFESFRQHRAVPLAEFLPTAHFNPLDDEAKCASHIRDVGGPAAYQEELARGRRPLNRGRYLPLDACAAPSGPEAGLELPCLFAEAVIAGATGRKVDAEELLSTAVATAVADVLLRYEVSGGAAGIGIRYPSTQPTQGDIAPIRRWVTDEVRVRFTTGAFLPEGQLSVFASSDLDKALAFAAKPPSAKDEKPPSLKWILDNVPPSLRIQAGALHLLLAPLDAPEIVVSDTADLKHRNVPDVMLYLGGLARDSLAALPGESQGATLARALFVQASAVPKGTVTVTTEGSGATMEFSSNATSPAAITGPGLKRLQDLYEMARLAARFQRLLGNATGHDPAKMAVVSGVIGLVQALDS